MWSVIGLIPLSARFGSKLVDVNFVVDKFALWQRFLQALWNYPRIIISSVFYIPKLSLHQCSISWLYHFTSASCPSVISLPASRALALSLHQCSTPWYYHFTKVLYPGIITSQTFLTLVLSLPWHCRFTNAPCLDIITSPIIHALAFWLHQSYVTSIITSSTLHILVLWLYHISLPTYLHQRAEVQ
jgi:hypothetical protein